MGDPTAEFFDDLRRRGHVPALNRVTGTMRFDLTDEGTVRHWRLSIRDGDITVSDDTQPADCVIAGERTFFDQLALGEVGTQAAWLSNRVAVEGSFRLLVLLGRLLPESAGVHDPRDPTSERGRGR
jgi:hypothetical protein